MPAMAVRRRSEESQPLFVSADRPEVAPAQDDFAMLEAPDIAEAVRNPATEQVSPAMVDERGQTDTDKLLAVIDREERKSELFFSLRMSAALVTGLTGIFALMAYPPFGMQPHSDLATFFALITGILPMAGMGIWEVSRAAGPLARGRERLEQLEADLAGANDPGAVFEAAKLINPAALYALRKSFHRRIARTQQDYAVYLDQQKAHLQLLEQVGPAMIHNRAVLDSMGVHVPKAAWFLELLDRCEERTEGISSDEIAAIRAKFMQIQDRDHQLDFFLDQPPEHE